MQLPGIITIKPQDTKLIEHVANMMGESFLEENWFITWLDELESINITKERRLEIMQSLFHDEIEAYTPYEGVYVLEDLTAATSAYLVSDLQGKDPEKIEKSVNSRFLKTTTKRELLRLWKREQQMKHISLFHWANSVEENDEYIYFHAWAVDPKARGKHSLTRLVTPFFNYADEHKINCYLDCYSDKLQSIYEHLGFELIDTLKDPKFSVFERRMIRRFR